MKKIFITLLAITTFNSCSTQETGKAEFQKIQEKFKQQEQDNEQSAIINDQHVSSSTNEVSVSRTVVTEKEELIETFVSLKIEKTEDQITLYLENPEAKEILSVRTWFAFPQGTLKITNLNLNSETFNLAAPEEFKVDTEKGIIKIGLATTQKITDTKIYIGSFTVENLTNNSVPLQCYDYKNESDSHCTVIGIERTNILQEPEGILID